MKAFRIKRKREISEGGKDATGFVVITSPKVNNFIYLFLRDFDFMAGK